MSFDVTFQYRKNPNRISPLGRGSILLEDVGMVLLGRFPRFHVPWMRDFFDNIICVDGMRTIPYLTISAHTPPKWWTSFHRLDVEPGRVGGVLLFRMSGRRRAMDHKFSERFQELHTIAYRLSGKARRGE